MQFLLAAIFVALCLLHYFSLRPLWLDERFVFESLTTYSFSQIFGPLKTQQAFPRVYLAVIKIFSENFQYHLLAVRLCSLIAALTAFFCWLNIYRRKINNFQILFLAILSYVCSYRLTYYGAELKHYSMDVLTVVLYLLFVNLQSNIKDEKSKFWLYAGSCILPLTVFFSYSAIFVFWISIFNFYLLSRKDKKIAGLFWLNLAASLICVGIFYYIDLRFSFRQKGILQYWDSYFILTDSPLHFLDSIFEGIKRITVYWCGTEKWQYRMAVPFMPFFVYALFRYGIKALKEDGYKIIQVESLAFILFIELFILGILKFYPFTGERITLFIAPFVFYLILKGINDLGQIRLWGKAGKWSEGLFLSYYTVYCLICLFNTAKVYLKLYS